jgi:SAM-dependent methyltransferase
VAEHPHRGDPDEATRELFRSIALERDGYYDATPGGAPRLSIWQRRIRRMVERTLDARHGSSRTARSLLDAGCGRGDFTWALATRDPQLTSVLGCDFCPELLRLAENHAHDPRVRFVAADLSSLPIADRGVDVTLCLNVLHHVRSERLGAVLGELARVTRHTLLLEIKNARSPYFRAHSRRVEGVPIFPVTPRDVAGTLRPLGFESEALRAIFGIEWLSPLLLLHLERQEPGRR